MSRIQTVASLPKPLTLLQLNALIGSPHSPCPDCKGCHFAVTNKGESICCNCDPDRAEASKGIAKRIVVTLGADGQPVALDHQEEQRRLERARQAHSKGEVVFEHDRQDWVAWTRPDGGRSVTLLDGCYLPEVSVKEAIWQWRPGT